MRKIDQWMYPYLFPFPRREKSRRRKEGEMEGEGEVLAKKKNIFVSFRVVPLAMNFLNNYHRV